MVKLGKPAGVSRFGSRRSVRRLRCCASAGFRVPCTGRRRPSPPGADGDGRCNRDRAGSRDRDVDCGRSRGHAGSGLDGRLAVARADGADPHLVRLVNPPDRAQTKTAGQEPWPAVVSNRVPLSAGAGGRPAALSWPGTGRRCPSTAGSTAPGNWPLPGSDRRWSGWPSRSAAR